MPGNGSWEAAEIPPPVPGFAVDWRTQIKPLNALGKIEVFVDRIAGILGSSYPSVPDKRLLLFFGDHGVAEEGVSFMSPGATTKIAHAVVKGNAVISVFARRLAVTLVPVDVG